MTKVIHCTCNNKAQDAIHGPGQRVHNKATSDKHKLAPWRCTVCKSMK